MTPSAQFGACADSGPTAAPVGTRQTPPLVVTHCPPRPTWRAFFFFEPSPVVKPAPWRAGRPSYAPGPAAALWLAAMGVS